MKLTPASRFESRSKWIQAPVVILSPTLWLCFLKFQSALRECLWSFLSSFSLFLFRFLFYDLPCCEICVYYHHRINFFVLFEMIMKWKFPIIAWFSSTSEFKRKFRRPTEPDSVAIARERLEQVRLGIHRWWHGHHRRHTELDIRRLGGDARWRAYAAERLVQSRVSINPHHPPSLTNKRIPPLSESRVKRFNPNRAHPIERSSRERDLTHLKDYFARFTNIFISFELLRYLFSLRHFYCMLHWENLWKLKL